MSRHPEPVPERPGRSSVPRVNWSPPDRLSAEALLEDYLDHLIAPLVGCVPYDERQRLRTELRSHLEALVEAHEEVGAAPAEAVHAALVQFGDPRVIARQWAREWLRASRPGQVESARPATLVAMWCFGLATVATIVLAIVTQNHRSGFPAMDGLYGPVVLFGMPMVAGLVTGLLAPARHVLGSFYALSLLILAMGLGGYWVLRGTALDELMILSLLQAAFWTPLGCASAALGGWLRRRRDERPRPWGLPV